MRTTLVLMVFIPVVVCFLLVDGSGPTQMVETLAHPVDVAGWSVEGLTLADGRLVRLPGIAELPQRSRALSEAVKRGVEISPDGRVCGLVKVHHWCGNDTVKAHIARVDLSDLLEFVAHKGRDGERGFTEFGWSMSEYVAFRCPQENP